jgi:FemAB-related protein (PEP-CTERM system-associated)
MLTVRYASDSDKIVWDAFVYNNSNATPYHLFGWKEAVERAYGHKCLYLIAETGGRITGVLPLFLFRIPLISKMLISLPFCDIGDELSENDDTRQALIKEAIGLAQEKPIKSFEIRTSKANFSDELNSNFKASTHSDKVRMLLELPSSSEELWNGFKSKLRSQVKKTAKNGLVFSWGSIEKTDDFYRVFSRNMRDLGSPVHSKRWILEIMRGYGENARIGIVYHDSTPIGCGIILCTKHCVSIPWASTLRDFNHLAPNMMLYWNFLKFASDSGRKIFDFGRSTPNEGTYRFKKQWGAEPFKLYWHKACFGSERVERNDTNSKRALAERLWQKAPLVFANIAGPVVRRYIDL